VGIGGDSLRTVVAGHPFIRQPRDFDGPHGRVVLTNNYSAVTGACMVLRKELFLQVGGFDAKHLAIAFNDVDLCLKVQALGYRNVYVPWAELYHYESLSRGPEDTPEKLARFGREAQVMRDRYGAVLLRDPCYSPHLSLDGSFTPAISGDFEARLNL
jgi:GT2 family glycosyltransferase